MAEKITTENKIRADTAGVNTVKIETDEAGASRNMTGTGRAGSTNISGGNRIRQEKRNITKRDAENAPAEAQEEKVGKKKEYANNNLITDGKGGRADDGADEARKKRNKKVSRAKTREFLSRSELQAKKSGERGGIRRKMATTMAAVGALKDGLYADPDDDEETSEKLVRKGRAVTGKVGSKFYQRKGIKEKQSADVKNMKKSSSKVRAPKKKKDDAYKVNGNARKQAAEQIKKEQARRSQEMQTKKAAQKRMIRKEYAKEVREKEKVKQTATKVSRKIQELAAKHSTALVVIVLILILFLICFVLLGSCALGAAALSGEVSEGVYQSNPIDIENTELEFLYQEALLQYQIDTMSTTYPDYDEYHVSGGPIRHDSFALIAYFSAKYGIFTYADVYAEVDSLVDQMYQITFTESKRGPYTTYVPDGNGGYTLESYYITELTANIDVTPLEELIMANLTDEQKVHYERLMETKGGLQRYAAPVAGWSSGITEPYGYRSSPAGIYQNSGIYVHVESGSTVQAMCSGTVTAAGSGAYGNYVTITHESGYVATIAGISSVSVSVGSTVELKEALGTTDGDVYFEISYDGVYYNPHFFVHY